MVLCQYLETNLWLLLEAETVLVRIDLCITTSKSCVAEESIFLTKYASKVYMIVRRDQLRASKVMSQRVLSNPKIEVLWNRVPLEAKGDGKLLKSLVLENTKTGTTEELPVNGLFYAIGHVPNTAFLNNALSVNGQGYVQVKPGSSETSVEGVFAAGDVQDFKYRQAITAAGSGCMAALDCERWLEANEH